MTKENMKVSRLALSSRGVAPARSRGASVKKVRDLVSRMTLQRSLSPTNGGPGESGSGSIAVAYGSTLSTRKPVMTSTRDGVRIHHSEFVTDISGSTSFTATKLSVNPGVGLTFPWLSSVARRYETYSFQNLSFEYRTMAPSTSYGYVMLAFDSDAADSTPISKIQAGSYQFARRSPPWRDMSMALSGSILHKLANYFTRSSTVSNTDIKTYDVGNVYIITDGQAGTSLIGELHVTYDIVLSTPQLEDNDWNGFTLAASAGLAAATFAGSNCATNARSNVSVTVSATGDRITFNQYWTGFAAINWVGTVITGAVPSVGSTVTIYDQVNTAGTAASLTNAITTLWIRAAPGQVLMLQPAATTITAFEMNALTAAFSLDS